MSPHPEQVKAAVDSWVETLKIPDVSGAYIREDENFLNIITNWSADDAEKKERLVYSKMYAVLKSSLELDTPIVSSPGTVTVNEKLSVAARSGQKRAILVDGVGTANSKDEFLQIWSADALLKTYNLKDLDLHQNVYTSAGWGVTMAWSQDESKLAYIAEQKIPKSKSFYSSTTVCPKNKGSERTSEEKVEKGEEYIYRQTWGEQLTGSYQSVIVVLDLNTDEFKVLPLPEGSFPTDIQWIKNSHICGCTYPLPLWRLGLIFCSNRESRIFSVQADGENFQFITEAKKAARSPRVRPDGNFVVWQERLLDGAHDRARSIHGVELTNGAPSNPPQLIYASNPENGMPIYQDFSRNCWSSNGTTLFAVTPNNAVMICLVIPIATPSQVSKIDRVDAVLSITSEYLLVSSSTSATNQQLRLLSISDNFRSIPITPSSSMVKFPVEMQLVSGEASPPSIYHGPTVGSVPPNSIPLIAFPHGGPHSNFVDTFSREVIYFLKLGFAVIRLNYVGSIGGTRDTADDLLGRVGDRDVKDCQNMVEQVLKSMPVINPDKVVLFGGSHGGFLSCHLSGQYPSVYKAAAVRNPVTDLGTLVGTSDIADWTYAEAGVRLPENPDQPVIPTARNLDDAQKYITASPIHLAQHVQAPTLLLLGSEDLRVPAQQGINYYRALKAYGKVAEIRMYPDNHSLVKAPVRLDNIIHSALWFQRFLS